MPPSFSKEVAVLFDKEYDLQSMSPDIYYNIVKSNMFCEEIAEELMKNTE